ncbi:unnamed protein product, partial [Oikopleura dioica]
DLLVAEHFPA